MEKKAQIKLKSDGRKPDGYWTKARCINSAKPFSSKTDWVKNFSGALDAAQRHGWLDECCKHMSRKSYPAGYWTKERCRKDALKHQTKGEWSETPRSGYQHAIKNKWLDHCCAHMKDGWLFFEPKWPLKACKAEALKFQTKMEWLSNSPASYQMAHKRKWVDDCCAHMVSGRTIYWEKHRKWTKNACIKDASHYETKRSWDRNSAAYGAAHRNGWLDDCCAHMKLGRMYYGPLAIHTFLLKHNIAYIAEKKFATLSTRMAFDFYLSDFNLIIEYHGIQHKTLGTGRFHDQNIIKRDQIKRDWAKKNRVCYIAILDWEIKTEDNIEALIIKKLTAICALRGKQFKLPGSRRLTKQELHFLSSKFKWDKESCLKDAKKYNTVGAWAKLSTAADTAHRKGWYAECIAHMDRDRFANKYWTLKRCKEDALKHKTRASWGKAKRSGYSRAQENGWLVRCCKHMVRGQHGGRFWTLKRCIDSAKKHQAICKWQKTPRSGYDAALANGWLSQCTKHMVSGYSLIPKKWTEEICIREALKYKTIAEWRASGNSYSAAHKNGWLVQCCAHMDRLRKPNGYWTLAVLKADAKKYKTRSEWCKNSPGYARARVKGWIEECCEHMVPPQKPNGYWTFERIAATTRGFKNKGYTAWCKANTVAYGALQKCKRYDEIKALFN